MANAPAPGIDTVGVGSPHHHNAAGRPRLRGPIAKRVRAITLSALVVLALLNGADVVTTHMLLADRAVEANPLSSVLLANQSLLWVKLVLLGALGLRVVHSRPRLGVMGAACFAAGIYATAVLSNILVLRLAGGG